MHLLKAAFVFTMRGQLMRMNYTLSGGLLLQKIKLSALAHQLGQKISQLFSLTLTNSPQLSTFLSIIFLVVFCLDLLLCIWRMSHLSMMGLLGVQKYLIEHLKKISQNYDIPPTAYCNEDLSVKGTFCEQIPF